MAQVDSQVMKRQEVGAEDRRGDVCDECPVEGRAAVQLDSVAVEAQRGDWSSWPLPPAGEAVMSVQSW